MKGSKLSYKLTIADIVSLIEIMQHPDIIVNDVQNDTIVSLVTEGKWNTYTLTHGSPIHNVFVILLKKAQK